MLSFFENLKSVFGKKAEQTAAIAAPIIAAEPVEEEPEDTSVCPFSFRLNDDGQASLVWNDEPEINASKGRPFRPG